MGSIPVGGVGAEVLKARHLLFFDLIIPGSIFKAYIAYNPPEYSHYTF